MKSLLYIACMRDQHSAFPIGSLVSAWCGLCGENCCCNVSVLVDPDGRPLVCRRSLPHGGLHREGAVQWGTLN